MTQRDIPSVREIEMKTIEVLSSVTGIPRDKILPKSDLKEDLGIDSFLALELKFSLEDTLGLESSDEKLATLKTVEDVLKFVSARVGVTPKA